MLSVVSNVRDGAAQVLRLPGFTALARLGYASRAGFYLVLAGLVVQVAVDHGGGKQADGNGALSVVAATGVGLVLIALAAAGFAILGIERVVASIRHKDDSTKKRITTATQGLFYCALTAVPASYLAGDKSTSSNQSQRKETAKLLGMTGGREIVVAVGLIVIGVCLWQIRTALADDFMSGLEVPRRGRLHALALWSGRAGIAARAIVFLPIGGFLIWAGVTFDPAHSNGLDVELSKLAARSWGAPVLAVIALGLVVFAVYSGIEAGYRDLSTDA